jgi:nucleotide sugar dehydrogenase
MKGLPRQIQDHQICVMGLGYVGLTLAVVMADVGFDVLGVEIRDDVLEKLKRGEPSFFEPGLKEKLERVIESRRLSFHKNIPPGRRASAYILTVGTPLGGDGKPRLDMIETCAREVRQHLKEGDIVILRSTVMLGTTRRLVLPILLESGVQFDLAFCPERTLEGQALQELRALPQIVGGFDFKSVVRASQIFQMLTPTVVRVDDLETAEMIKLVDNTQRDVHFAFSNEIARLCDGVGIRAAQVIQAGKLGYPRTNLPLPGPVGGPCLSKDTYILAEGVRHWGLEPEIALAARRLNEFQPESVVKELKRLLKDLKGFPTRLVITLLGLAFKGRPVTDDLRGTMARPLLDAVKNYFPESIYRGFDPVVTHDEVRHFGLEPVATLESAFEGSHLVFILNNHPLFSSMALETLVKRMANPSLVYDFWNHHVPDQLHFPPHVGYIPLGSFNRALLPGGRL